MASSAGDEKTWLEVFDGFGRRELPELETARTADDCCFAEYSPC